eukprot:Sdes_comp19742_c0_seq1m11744
MKTPLVAPVEMSSDWVVECSKESPPLEALLVAKFLNTRCVQFSWAATAKVALMQNAQIQVKHSIPIAKLLCRLYKKDLALYKGTPLELSEIDHFVDFAQQKLASNQQDSTSTQSALELLNLRLSNSEFLVKNHPTFADIVVWLLLREFKCFSDASHQKENPQEASLSSLHKWFAKCLNLPQFSQIHREYPPSVSSSKQAFTAAPPQSSLFTGSKISKEQGVFTELPGAVMGQVVTRFPPEASGYLHIGHAKAALLNNHYARSFGGTLIMRFDDTNPSKEKDHFEKVILEDLTLLKIHPDKFSHTSDHFEFLLQCAEKLLKAGKAYIDDTPVNQLREERMVGTESKHRNNSVATNLAMWQQMKKGTPLGLSCVMRAKIDMQCLNKAMRDPVLYRCNLEPHIRTGSKYIVYPTYDFACPIVDSIEHVSHALRTTEYHDRNDQYYWMLDALQLRKPIICDFSRVNMVHTLLSKRKLHYFVEKHLVQGWDDPRMPTVRGILRRGLTLEALTEFIIAQGSSKSVVLMEWDKIWRMNIKVIDPIAPRVTAISSGAYSKMLLEDAHLKGSIKEVPLHKKNPQMGNRKVAFARSILLEQQDAQQLKEGEEITLMDWGNCFVTKISRDAKGAVVSLQGKLHLEGDFKKTDKK